MNKSELIDVFRREARLSISNAKEIVELFFDEIADALSREERVEIRDFCSLYVKEYDNYTGRNPKTGRPIEVKPKKLPFFKCGKELKERVDYKTEKRRKA